MTGLVYQFRPGPEFIRVRRNRLYHARLGTSEFESRYRWNPELGGGSGRYIDRNGQMVSREVILGQLERVLVGAKGEMIEAAEDLLSGKMTVQGWYNLMARRVKVIHHMSASVAVGGWAQLGPADVEMVNELIKRHVGFLNNFATEVDEGIKSPKRFMLRVKSYADAGRSTAQEFSRVLAARNHQATHEMRVLGPADHCPTKDGLRGCVELAGRWEPVGSLPAIGETPCRHNCHCHFIFGRKVGSKIVEV